MLAFDRDDFRRSAVASGRPPVAEIGLAEEFARLAAAGRIVAPDDVASAVKGAQMTIVAVGTPAKVDGSISLDDVQAALEDIGRAIRATRVPHVVVLRSTVPPGSSEEVAIPLLEQASGRRLGDGLEYHFHPEFLRAGSALQDFETPPLIVIGERDGERAPMLRALYHKASAPIQTTTYRTAEAVKLLSNVFHAVKIGFANEAGAALAAMGVDARAAFGIFCADTTLNISAHYLDPGFAFGGSCLPKDIGAFLHASERCGVAAPFLGGLPAGNKAVARRGLELIAALPGRSVALFGLAFKPGTDDVRNSPFARLALDLVEQGRKVAIVDPLVSRAWKARPDSLAAEQRLLAGLMTDDALSALDNSEILVLGHVSPGDLDVLNKEAGSKLVVDLAPKPQLAIEPCAAYRGLCW